MNAVIVENAKIMPKGQITIPKDIRSRLGVEAGDRVALICEGDKVTLMNAAVYAMRMLQKDMEGEFAKVGIYDDDDVMALVKEVRNEIETI